MRTFFALVCSLALSFAVNGAQEKKKEEKPASKKSAQTTQGVQPRAGGPKAGGPHQQANTSQRTPKSQGATSAEKGKGKGTAKATEPARRAEVHKTKGSKQHKGNPAQAGNAAAVAGAKGPAKQAKTRNTAETGKHEGASKPPPTGKRGATGVAAGKPIKPQHFSIAKQPNTAKAPPVKFQQGRRIKGSQNWQGQQYSAFRNYHSEWHDQGWWHNHYNNIVFAFGAPYFFNAGYWYPAWGYSPNAYYAWDGPIYAYNNLPPDQVIANVQAALQQQGYYHGDVDGLIGPLTRGAIADYQRDHSLYVTSAIDEPTLQSLGMT